MSATRLRLRTDRPLPERTAQVFRHFLRAARVKSVVPLYWKEFYHFVHACHQWRVALTKEDMRVLLVSNGFNHQEARSLAELYQHGRQLLRNRVIFAYKYPRPRR